MAIRQDATGESLTRTANLPSATSATLMGWFKISTDRNTYTAMMAFGPSSPGNYYAVMTDVDGTTMALWNGGTFPTGTNLTAGTWYHLAMTVNGAGGGTLLSYVNGVQDISSSTIGGLTLATIYFGNDVDGDWLNGCYAAIKVYDAVLTADEIKQEMKTYLPVRVTNLNWFWPGILHTDTSDYGGNGRNATVNGTLATEDGPPIAWGSGGAFFPYAAAAAATVTPPRLIVVNQAAQRALTR